LSTALCTWLLTALRVGVRVRSSPDGTASFRPQIAAKPDGKPSIRRVPSQIAPVNPLLTIHPANIAE
jgi:hypothetical protein